MTNSLRGSALPTSELRGGEPVPLLDAQGSSEAPLKGGEASQRANPSSRGSWVSSGPSLLAVWRAVMMGFLVLSVAIASAQNTKPIDMASPTINPSGSVMELVQWTGASGLTQSMPDKATYSSMMPSSTSGLNVTWEITRVKGWNRITGTAYLLPSAEGVYSISHGAWSGVREEKNFQREFWSWFSSRSTDEARYGEYILTLTWRQQSGYPIYNNVFLQWTIRPEDYAGGSVGNGNGGNGNGGGGSGGGGTDPGDTEGFWENLFIPDQEQIDDLKEAAFDLMNWGPFGWYGVVSGRIQDNESTTRIDPDKPYSIRFTIPSSPTAPGVGGSYDMDMSQYELVFKFVRALEVFGLWYAFIFVIGRRVYEKI